MAKERTCFCCMTKYEYCHSCKDYNPVETWRYLYHDQNCKMIGDIWFAYRGKEISKEDARAALKSFDLSKILKSGSPVVPELKEILGIDLEEPKNEEVKGEKINVDEEPSVVEEDKPQKSTRSTKKK